MEQKKIDLIIGTKAPPSTPRVITKPSKSHKSMGEAEADSSSDEEWTHVPVSNLREYISDDNIGDSKQPRKTQSATGEYVEISTNEMEIISDPREAGIRTWVETYTMRLYVFWVVLITVSCILAAIAMYMLHFVTKVYSQVILVDLFWRSNYANILAVILCGILTSFLGIFFLCYPDPQVWKKYIRSVVSLIVNSVNNCRHIYSDPFFLTKIFRDGSLL